MFDICTVGHITLDKIVTPQSITFMPGGTAFYFSKALQHFPVKHLLVTALATSEKYIIDKLEEDGITVIALPSPHTLYFENIYNESQDNRIQNVLATATAFQAKNIEEVNAGIFHLGPLLNNDFDPGFITYLAGKGTVSLDIQGLLRVLNGQKVLYKDWAEKDAILPHVSILKANEFEMEVLTGITDEREGAKFIAGMGVKEVIITMGSRGSLIYTNNIFYEIPAYKPAEVTDATGCGDTYMAGYLYQRINGSTIAHAGRYAAAMASIKIAAHGPFAGNNAVVDAFIKEQEIQKAF